jgi:hypothetical protein
MRGTIKVALLYDVQRAKYVIMELVYMEASINLNIQTLKPSTSGVTGCSAVCKKNGCVRCACRL